MDFIDIGSDGRWRSKVLFLCLLAANFVILQPFKAVLTQIRTYRASVPIQICIDIQHCPLVQQAEWLCTGVVPITQ